MDFIFEHIFCFTPSLNFCLFIISLGVANIILVGFTDYVCRMVKYAVKRTRRKWRKIHG